MQNILTVTPQTAKAWVDAGQAVFVDVREPIEYKHEHIKNSHLLPLGRCTLDALPPVPEGQKIIIHCKAGVRGEKACRILMENLVDQLGDRELYNLEGGLDAWIASGLPTEKTQTLPLMRQVQIAVGGLLVVFTVLGFLVSPWMHALSGLIGLGLLNAGITGWCGMALLLAKMPWNK